jgi:tetratricopeptide (TPR) repeat protein
MDEIIDDIELLKKDVCINCASPAVLKGFPNALCENCRESLIKFPIPNWIKAFGVGVLLIVLFSLYKVPKNISIGMHLAKGETAMEEKKFITAQNEFSKGLKRVPGNIEMQSNLMIASYRNGDYMTYDSMITILKDKKFEDQTLFEKVNGVVNEADKILPLEDFSLLFKKYDSNFNKIPDTALLNYLMKTPKDFATTFAFANRLLDNKEYAKADSLLVKILVQDKNNVPALMGMSSVKRMESDYESSINYCNQILAINAESVYALSSKARTYLRQKNDSAAFRLAKQSYALANNDLHSIGSLALVYHFMNNFTERDKFIKSMQSLSSAESISTLEYVNDVISGKEKFRN